MCNFVKHLLGLNYYKMLKYFRWQEYQVLLYRILLVYVFYFLARLLFYFYNSDLLVINSVGEFFKLYYHGLAFDTTSIIYANGLFILLSILPLVKNTTEKYQKFLFYVYFVLNGIAFSTNFIDLIYYRFIFGRTTIAVWDSLEHESNKLALFSNFLVNYWHVFLLLFLSMILWIFLYKRVTVKSAIPFKKIPYFVTSIIGFLVIVTMCIGGIRGDFKKSTRPINLLDASRHVTHISQGDFVLNTPFAIIRTMTANTFKKVEFMPQSQVDEIVQPIKQYANRPETKPNIVIFILESFGREYLGAFNKNTEIPKFVSYTPFLDSLTQHSMIYTNGYANGYKSIHGMSSVLSGIPSFKDAFTSSAYSKQEITSLVSVLKEEGYETNFYHGAPNGSMGFLGFANILGMDQYYGKTEFNDDSKFDGVWGIWDDPFFQYMKTSLDQKKKPFLATMFSVSSHEPYKVPAEFEGKFPKGTVNIHESIGYTDYALRHFFAEAKKSSWYENTIFVLVADHGNTVAYDEYMQEMNRHTVPIMFFKPGGEFVGSDDSLSQQMDIFPTLMDMIGYKKPFRSWGRSLIDSKDVAPFVIRYSANMYQFMAGNYICTFDGSKAIGFFDINDKDLKNNLISNRNDEMDKLEIRCKAYIQDYMNRIIDKKL